MRQLRHLLLVLLAVLPLGVVAPASAQNSVATDTAALTAFYNATNGANWTDNTNWGIAPALSTWHGVTTDSDGRVTELELDGNGLSGTLPTELGDLTELASLRLNGNVYLAGPLPAGLRELSALATMDLTDTELCAPEDTAFQDWTATISFSGLICPPESQTVIDVAVFYTPAARDDAGGTAAIEAEIDLMAAETNLAYRASGVNQRLALAAVEEVEYTATTGRGDIERLQDPSDGHMDEIHTIRDQVAADVVLLIISGSGGGRAYRILTPANASAANAFAWMHLGRGGSVTFAHELGHLMGLAHDRWSACLIGCGATATAYAHGYVNQRAFDAGAPFAARWRTVMAYNSQCREAGCPQLLRFSNPDQIYPDPGGDPLGVPGREPSTAQHGPADAARALNRTRATVASFRTAPAVTVSFGAAAYTAAEGGEAATVTVNLNPAPERRVSIPLVSMGAAGATASDYTAPRSVTFAATETAQTFTVTAVDDAADDDGETVTLAFDTRVLPSGMTDRQPGHRHGDARRRRHGGGRAERERGGPDLRFGPGRDLRHGRRDRGHGALRQERYRHRHAATRPDGGQRDAADDASGRRGRGADVRLHRGRGRQRHRRGGHRGRQSVGHDSGQRQPGRVPDPCGGGGRCGAQGGWRPAAAARSGGGRRESAPEV